MVRQSNSSSAKLRASLSDAYALGDDKYPTNQQAAFHFLENFSKDVVKQTTVTHEGRFFSQIGNQQKRKSSDKDYTTDWYDKEKYDNINCYNCDEKGHPAPHWSEGYKKPDAKYSKSKKESTMTTADPANQSGTLPICSR